MYSADQDIKAVHPCDTMTKGKVVYIYSDYVYALTMYVLGSLAVCTQSQTNKLNYHYWEC